MNSKSHAFSLFKLLKIAVTFSVISLTEQNKSAEQINKLTESSGDRLMSKIGN